MELARIRMIAGPARGLGAACPARPRLTLITAKHKYLVGTASTKIHHGSRSVAADQKCGEIGMARIDLDDFHDDPLTRIYLAAYLKEAKQVEDVLTQHGIDYAVEVESYIKRFFAIFDAEYHGAGFFVRVAHANFARNMLREAGLSAGIQE